VRGEEGQAGALVRAGSGEFEEGGEGEKDVEAAGGLGREAVIDGQQVRVFAAEKDFGGVGGDGGEGGDDGVGDVGLGCVFDEAGGDGVGEEFAGDIGGQVEIHAARGADGGQLADDEAEGGVWHGDGVDDGAGVGLVDDAAVEGDAVVAALPQAEGRFKMYDGVVRAARAQDDIRPRRARGFEGGEVLRGNLGAGVEQGAVEVGGEEFVQDVVLSEIEVRG